MYRCCILLTAAVSALKALLLELGGAVDVEQPSLLAVDVELVWSLLVVFTMDTDQLAVWRDAQDPCPFSISQ
jgi:hypothetical protein